MTSKEKQAINDYIYFQWYCKLNFYLMYLEKSWKEIYQNIGSVYHCCLGRERFSFLFTTWMYNIYFIILSLYYIYILNKNLGGKKCEQLFLHWIFLKFHYREIKQMYFQLLCLYMYHKSSSFWKRNKFK